MMDSLEQGFTAAEKINLKKSIAGPLKIGLRFGLAGILSLPPITMGAEPSKQYQLALAKPTAKDAVDSTEQKVIESSYGHLKLLWEEQNPGKSFNIVALSPEEHVRLLLRVSQLKEIKGSPDETMILNEAFRVGCEQNNTVVFEVLDIVKQKEGKEMWIKKVHELLKAAKQKGDFHNGLRSVALLASGGGKMEEMQQLQIDILREAGKQIQGKQEERDAFLSECMNLAKSDLEIHPQNSRNLIGIAKKSMLGVPLTDPRRSAAEEMDKAAVALSTLERNPKDTTAALQWSLYLMKQGRYAEGFTLLSEKYPKHSFITKYYLGPEASALKKYQTGSAILKDSNAKVLERYGINLIQEAINTDPLKDSSLASIPISEISLTKKKLAISSEQIAVKETTQVRGGIQFNKGDYVETPIKIGDKSFSIDCIVTPETFTRSSHVSNVVVGNSENGGMAICLDEEGKWSIFAVTQAGEAVSCSAAEKTEMMKRAHIVGEYDQAKKELRLYVNGKLSAKKTLSSGIRDNSFPLWVGADPGSTGPQHRWLGIVEAISTTVGTTRRTADFAPFIDFEKTDANTQAIYYFGNTSNGKVIDASGKNNHAKVNGNPVVLKQ